MDPYLFGVDDTALGCFQVAYARIVLDIVATMTKDTNAVPSHDIRPVALVTNSELGISLPLR